MATTWVDSIIGELQRERTRLENELRRVSDALSAFGKVYSRGHKAKPRVGRKHWKISAAGRKRIAEAQRARWAKVRAAKQGK